MPESEILRTIVQGGSFGLTAILVVWLLFYGAPMLRATLEKLSTDHKVTMEALGAAHVAAVTKISEECRQERLASQDQFTKTVKEIVSEIGEITNGGRPPQSGRT